MKKFIKKIASKIPENFGKRLAFIDYRYRLGKAYNKFKIASTESMDEDFIFYRMKNLVQYAEENIPFYIEFYKKKHFSSESLKSFSDLINIPIITKADLQLTDFENRISSNEPLIITNTGGTTGQPLKLALDSEAYAREWAHMHTIWERLGYKTKDLKLTIRGVNLGNQAIKYNFIHNEFQVNAYCRFDMIINQLAKILQKNKIKYLHGYPSGIYEFVKNLELQAPDLLTKLKNSLCGVFFGSEFPAPIYRTYIENALNVKTVSWYGHTEMAVLAYEKEPFVYYPFQSYGYTECIQRDGLYHLIGSTIHNKIGPLIRYDTGDIIEPLSFNGGLLESFKISNGRIGEFVTDRYGRQISLTALIFGRHHELFNFVNFIQVRQVIAGELVVLVTSNATDINCTALFDSSGVDMNFYFEMISKPIKTPAGKVNLLVK